MESNSYYSLTTKCFSLHCSHPEWLVSTQLFYNQILKFYYNLFLDIVEEEEGLVKLGSQQILRELEKRTIIGRNREPVSNPLPWSRVPLYFRRAAANAGIAAGISYLNRETQSIRTECFHKSVTYYKGTYKNFDQIQITLKVWTGNEWKWMRCRLSGNAFRNSRQILDSTTEIGMEIDILSPCVVVRPKEISLHVPVKEKVADGSNAKTRMAQGTNICSVQFTNGDSIAVCVALDGKSFPAATHFCKGGSRYRHTCKKLMERLDKSKISTEGQENLRANQKYWMRLKNLSISYSHQISRQIVDFAKQENCGIIVLPKYGEQYSRIVMKMVGNWSPLHLSNRIRSQLNYKAWQQGILVLEVDAKDTGSKCARCGAPIKKEGEEYRCPNAHRSNRHLNTAVNLGRKCRESFNR